MRQFVGDALVVRERLAEVRARLDSAAIAGGRRPADVELLVASKYVALEDMAVLADAGVRLVGESRAQDLVAKHQVYGDIFVWDFIGHLQSRKTRLVLPLARRLHSVWTMSVVQELQHRAQNTVDVLLEVNIAGEPSKPGLAPTQVDAFLDEASACTAVSFSGLMCMPPLSERPEDAAVYFARTRALAQRLSAAWRGRYTFDHLSMGTSADYEIAVREGATTVRVGTGVLF